MSMKRRRTAAATDGTSTKKVRRTTTDGLEDELSTAEAAFDTPTKSTKHIRGILVNGATTPRKSDAPRDESEVATPKSRRRVLFSAQKRSNRSADAPAPEVNGSPGVVRNADTSARRKSARRLLEQPTQGDGSEDDEAEEILAQRIWNEEAGVADDDSDEEEPADEIVVDIETPRKRGPGRPRKKDSEKVSRKRCSPTPPQDLPSHERYFYENRPGGNKTSNNTLSAHDLLSHEEYFEQMQDYTEPHPDERETLVLLHERAFDQWIFELENGFNICLFGYGSKRELVDRFAHHLHASQPSDHEKRRIILINGYNPSITARDILHTILSTLLSKKDSIPGQPLAQLALLQQTLSDSHESTHITLLLNSIDAPPLRRPATQSILTALAKHAQISLLATADTATFPLLWDLGQRASFNFLFHDATTFAPLSVEVGDVVENVRELLGRAGRRGVAGRDGVSFVLRSLPENARGLFRLLIGEQLAGADLAEDAARQGATDADDGADGEGARQDGVEWGTLYHKAVEEFVCSNEMTFRTLLKEFLDHQMIEVRRDGLGTERLIAPFRREELEGLLEELVGT